MDNIIYTKEDFNILFYLSLKLAQFHHSFLWRFKIINVSKIKYTRITFPWNLLLYLFFFTIVYQEKMQYKSKLKIFINIL